MSKTVDSVDRKKSFESHFADEVRRLVSHRKKVIEVCEAAVQQQSSEKDRGIAEIILKAGITQKALALDAFDPADRLLRDVFAFCSLDSTNPWHWRILLEATMEVAFKKSGSPDKWDEAAFFELQMDIRELRELEPLAKYDEEIARLLQKREPFKSKYTMKLGYLRKLVGKAQDPRFNPMVEYKNDGDFLEFLAKRRREKTGVSAEMASSLIEKFVEDQIETSVAAFKKRWEAEGRTWSEAMREELIPHISRIVRAHLTGKDVK